MTFETKTLKGMCFQAVETKRGQTDIYLHRPTARDEKVRVEVRGDAAREAFGKGKYEHVTFGQFMARFSKGDDTRYLTASPSARDAHGRPEVASAPAMQLLRAGKVPARPALAGRLVGLRNRL